MMNIVERTIKWSNPDFELDIIWHNEQYCFFSTKFWPDTLGRMYEVSRITNGKVSLCDDDKEIPQEIKTLLFFMGAKLGWNP